MTEHNNPPAFPSKKRIHKAGYATAEFEPVNGMTLLDHFAGLAMQGMQADSSFDASVQKIAEAAYSQADAMLKERQKWIK